MNLIKLIGSWIVGDQTPKIPEASTIFWEVKEVTISIKSKNESSIELKATCGVDYNKHRINLQSAVMIDPLESIEITATSKDTHTEFTIWEGVEVENIPSLQELERKPVDDLERVIEVIGKYIQVVKNERWSYDPFNKQPIELRDSQGRNFDVRDLLERVKELKEN